MIVTSEAVVLRCRRFGDTSLIATLYTRAFGKMKVVAKGARGAKSRFGSSLDPMRSVTAVLYKKENRDLHLLSQCDVLRPWRGLVDDLRRMGAGMAVVELVDAVAHDEEHNEPLFALLVETLETISDATKNPANAFYMFEVRLLGLLGFRPSFHVCMKCGRALGPAEEDLRGVRLVPSAGGLACGACAPGIPPGPALSGAAVRVLQRLQEFQAVNAALAVALDSQTREQVQTALRMLLERHVEGLRPSKSESVFSSIV